MEPDYPKLSLVAQLDDICRRCSAYTDTADEELLLEFVRSQEECRKRWHAAVIENAASKKLITSLTTAKKELEQKYANVREVLQREILRREKCEVEAKILRRQVQLIREFLANAPELPNETAEKLSVLVPIDGEKLLEQVNRVIDESVGSELSPSGDSLDDSDDGGCGANSPRLSQGKRRYSSSFKSTSPVTKKPKAQDETQASGASALHTTVMIKNSKELVATSRVVSQSVTPATPTPQPATPVTAAQAALPHVPTTSKFASGSAPSTPVAQRRAHVALGASMPKRSNSAERLPMRQHTFVTKTALRRDGICGPCGKCLGFYKTVFKCSCCQSVCHPQCRDQVPLPCIAPCDTPKHKLISDCAPPTPPMVPALVVHCIQEVERRGLDAVGIYRVPGAEREVREIREKFQSGRGLPNLSKADIYAVCGTLKDFLRSLSETLITKSLWHTFAEASQLEGEDRVWSTWQAVSKLPRANRDTLALLVLHLQTVAAHPAAKMPIPNLVRIFAPTVVGFSSDKATTPTPGMLGDVEHQNRVMEALLALPTEYWTRLLKA
ncbi:uncharacterized protein LOC144128232 [Amblyomma americanum]